MILFFNIHSNFKKIMNALINLKDCNEYMTIKLNNKEHQIKLAGTVDDPYFCGKDVCEILGYANVKQAIVDRVKLKHKRDLKTLIEADRADLSASLGCWESKKITFNEGKAVYISEPGLYSLIMHSKAPFAEAFQDIVYEIILPSIRKYGSYQIEQQLNESIEKLAIKDKELESEKQKSFLEKQKAEEAIESKKISEARAAMIERLSTAHRERLKNQVFYIVTTQSMAIHNEFKIGGIDCPSNIKKRLAIYNTGSSGINLDSTFKFVAIFEVSNYRQVESRVKELLVAFRSKRHPNSENFCLHFKIFKPLIELIVENYNEEIDKLNSFIKAFLDTHTKEYLVPLIPEAINPDDLPSEYHVVITKRKFGEQSKEQIKLESLKNDELQEVLISIVSQITESTITRNAIEDMLTKSNFDIKSHKRRIWDMAKEIIRDGGKQAKY